MTHSHIIDLRSDTVTKPSLEMRQAMAQAEVGDDVFGDDPTINRLQEQVAELLGKEAALYVPSGSMANQISIRAHTQPGDEIICHADSHIYHYEAGAPAALAGCSLRLLPGERGMFTADDVRNAIRPLDSHTPFSRLIIVENTHNRGGGSVWPIDRIAAIRTVAQEFDLRMHLDGARLMNACVATGCKPREYAKHFDTVSMCFSKGLGAPVGSAVAGSKETIGRIHRFRKMFGGGMRQGGIIAAGAIYALEHNIDRLAEDHANAKYLAESIAALPGITVDPDSVQTNMVYLNIDNERSTAEKHGVGGGRTAAELCATLKHQGLLLLPVTPRRIRAVTHLDISRDDIEQAISILQEVIGSPKSCPQD